MTATAPDRMSVLARIDFLSATLHNFATLARDGYTVAATAARIVELAFPNCPDKIVRLAMRYADRVRIASEFAALSGKAYERGQLTRLAKDAALFAEREAAAAGNDFEAAMRAHYAPPSE